MIDQKTTNRDYPLPHAENKLREDVVRLNDAFVDIDTDVDDLYDTTGNLSTQVTSLTQDTQNGVLWHANSTGSGTAYQVVLSPAPTILNSGLLVHMKAHVPNTGPATLNVNSLGIKAIKKADGSDLKAGDILSGSFCFLVYDGTNFQLINPKVDQAQTEVNTSNIMRAFEEIQESHGGSLLMEAGWSDSFGNANEQGADEVSSTGYQHDASASLYKGTDPGLNLNSDKNFDTESDYLQQEWTNSNQVTSQATVAGAAVTVSSGVWPDNCENARISFDSGTSWFDIENRNSDTQLDLFQTDLTKNQIYSASNELPNGQTAAEAFDDNPSTYWNPTNGNDAPQWLKVEFNSETVVNKINLNWYTTASYSYTFEGSNDDISYTTLLTIDTKSYTQNTPTPETFANNIAYKYYKINITAMTGGGFLIINEMEMFHIPTDGTFDYVMRMSELDSGEVKFNVGVASNGIDSDTVIVVHGDSDFSDSSTAVNKGTGTALGSNPPVINTSVKKFGAGSMQWPTGNNENHITFANNSDFRLMPNTTSDLFTIDFWIYLSSAISGANAICGMGVNSSSYYSLQFDSPTSFGLECYDNAGGSPGYSNKFFTISALSTGQWYHMALIKGWGGDSTKIALCINGVVNSTVNTWTADFYTPTTPGSVFYLGRGAYAVRTLKNAYLDEFRLSHSAIWTSNFTPPTFAYSGGSFASSEYISICDTESKKTDTSAWSDINSGSVTEILGSQNAYYWLVLDPSSNFGPGTEINILKNTDNEVAGNSSSYVPDANDADNRTLVDLFYSVGNNQTVTQIGIKVECVSPVDLTIMIFNEDSITQYDVLYSEAGFTHTGGGELEWFTLSTPYITPASGTIRIGYHNGTAGTLKYYQNDPATMVYRTGSAPTGNDVTFSNGGGQIATSYKHHDATPSIWRAIAKNDGAWKYNNDATDTAAENWVPSTVDDMLHAVSQAISSQSSNRMTGGNLTSMTDAEWEESGGWSNSVSSIVRGVTLYSSSSTQNPSVSQYRLNYDSERGAMDLRSKTYDPRFVPSEGYVWSRIEHSDSDGPGTFYVTRNGGTEWAAVPMAQQGLPLAGDIRIYRGTVDVSGQASGQDLRCRYQTNQGKDQFLHSWGLQAKSQ